MTKKLQLPFLATGTTESPERVNYNLLGLHKNEIFDEKGDLVVVQYFVDYDAETGIHSTMAVEERRTYTRDSNTGVLKQRSTDIDWYNTEGSVGASKTQVNKYYTAVKGFESNKKARQNLLNNASMYLLSQVGLTDAKAFWKTLGQDDVKDYKNIGDLSIIDSINNSVESYMNATIKATLVTILNITY